MSLPEEDQNVSDDDEWVNDDDEYETVLVTGPSQTQFTYNPVSQAPALTSAEKKLQIAALALEYGVYPSKDVNIRFIIGIKEINRPPGRRPREVDRFKRKWTEFSQFSRGVNWRRIMSNDFDRDQQHGRLAFVIDGVEWTSVVHYILGMMYINNPEFSRKFSLAAKEDESGFWGSTEGAERAHMQNIKFGPYEPDPKFEQNVKTYYEHALLAKFTQNPIAKKALLLTEDAVLSIRGGELGILDIPVLMEVREYIKKNPKLVFMGSNSASTQVEGDIPVLSNLEMMNYGYLSKEQILEKGVNDLVAGSISASSLYENEPFNPTAEIESIQISECIIYLYVGGLDKSIATRLVSAYGQPIFIQRHVYCLEKLAYDSKKIIMGYQRTPTSQRRNYYLFSASAQSLSFSIYLEPFKNSFGLFIISDRLDPQVLDLMRVLTDPVQITDSQTGQSQMVNKFILPTGMPIKKTLAVTVSPIIKVLPGRNRLRRQFVPFSQINRLYHRALAIKTFVDSPEIETGLDQNQQDLLVNILEQFLLGLADLNGEDLFVDNETDISIYEKFRSEIREKDLPKDPNLILTTLKQKIREADETALTEINRPLDIITIGSNNIYYRDLLLSGQVASQLSYLETTLKLNPVYNSMPEADRLDWLHTNLVKMVVSAEMLLPYEQQRSLPHAFYAYAHKLFGIDLEAFASPINSNMMMQAIPFGSLFDEIDKPFGSIGNIFRLDFPKFVTGREKLTVVMNPPFTEQLINDSCNLLEYWFNICQPKPNGFGIKLLVFFVTPEWPDSYHASWLKTYPMVKINRILDAKTYQYQNTSDINYIDSPVGTYLSVLTNDDSMFDNIKFNRMIRYAFFPNST